MICGTRLWALDSSSEENKKIYNREIQRLRLSIDDAKKKYGEDVGLIVATHYPPILDDSEYSIMNILKENNVKKYIYGHLHGNFQNVIEGQIEGIDFNLVSCDYLDFKLIKIC